MPKPRETFPGRKEKRSSLTLAALVSLTFLAATTRLVVLPRLVVLTTLLPTLTGLLALLASLALPALVLVLVHVASFLVRPMKRNGKRPPIVPTAVQQSAINSHCSVCRYEQIVAAGSRPRLRHLREQ